MAADRAKLAAELPETGDWQLVVFANEPSAPRAFTAKGELLKAIDEVVYDGGTDIAAAMATTTRGTPVLIFTDEVDTLAEKPFDLDGDRSVIVGSRPAPAQHTVEVRKVTKDEPMPKIAPKPSKLLASVWAARRMQDLATQADARQGEFLALGRRYGVAGPGLSLIVLETLDQWLEHRIEPPANLAIHAEWVKRRSNDFQASVFALEELNGLLAWCAANEATVGAVKAPAIDAAYRRDLPVKLRIVLSWDADETDIDLHVLEPNGEEAFYGNRRTAEGGFVSEDVTTGYGPEEYLKKDLETGVYRVLTNYYASHQTTLTGATTVQAMVYTDWGTDREKMQILTLRLDKPKDKVTVGEIRL